MFSKTRFFVLALIDFLAVWMATAASADWAVSSDVDLVQSTDQFVITHEWTSSATDSTAYDISSCTGSVEVRFDPSVSDSSTDATAELRLVRSSTDTAGRGRPIRIPTNDGTTWSQINAVTSGENYIIAHPTAATSGGDTARIEVRCTGAVSLREASSGSGILEGTFANLPADNSGGSLYYVTDCIDAACAAGGGTVGVTKEWDGDSWENIDAAGSVTGLTNPMVADLDADGFDITSVGTLRVDDQPIFYSEDYDRDGTHEFQDILDALAACDTYAEANDVHGIVMLQRGKLGVTVSGSFTSPLVSLPTNTGAGGENASCDLVGWGSVKDYAPGGPDPVGSSLWFYNPDSMVADATGRKVLIHAAGHEQVLKGFSVVMSGSTGATDVDGTTMLLAASADNDGGGADAFGDDGIKRAVFDDLHLASAYVGNGTIFESIFFLDNTVTNSSFYGGAAGWLLTTQSGTANNANFIAGNRFTANTVAIDIPGALSCQDLYLTRNTIENNAYGIRLRSGSTCRVSSFGTHWEQLYTGGSQTGVNDVLIEDDDPVFFSYGDFYDSIFNATAATSALDHIERTVANAATHPPDMLIGVNERSNEYAMYTYASGGRIVVNENFSAAGLGLPRASDCSVSPYSTNGRVCVDSDNETLWVSGVQIGSATGDITAVGPGYASGSAFTDGAVSTGSNLFVWEGTTADANEFTISFADSDPSADVLWLQPDALSITTFPTGVRTLATLDGTETFTNKTITSPILDDGTVNVDGGTLEIPNSTSLPGTCTVGQIYMDTDATSGQRIYACQSTNTWALQGDGGSGSFDATTVDAVTWSDGANASNAWTFNVSGTDPVVTWGNGTVDFSTAVTATSFTADPSDTAEIRLTSATGADEAVLDFDDNGSTTSLTVKVDDGNGDDQSYLEFDGATVRGIWSVPLTLASEATPTTDADGEISVDVDGWGTGFDAIEFFNGTASAYVVAATASDTPSNGQVPKFNTGGSITWEDDTTGGTTTFDSIGDATGTGSVSFQGFDQDIVSSEDGGDILTITNTDADHASDSIALRLASNDATGDANLIFLRATADEDGTPTTEFNVASTGTAGGATMTLGSSGVVVTTDGDGAITFLGQSTGSDEDLTMNLDDTSNTVGISSSTGVTSVDFGTLFIDAPAKVASSTGGTLATNTITLATAAGDYDLPDECDTATGAWATIIVRDASETVSITTADTGDVFSYKGIATLVANDEMDSPGAALDSITFVCMAADSWIATSNSGSWTDGGTAD